MKAYQEMSREELQMMLAELQTAYEDAKGKGLKLDMSRGKPAADQLDLSMDLMDIISRDSDGLTKDAVDGRNYGIVDGIAEAKKLMADMIGTTPEHVIVGGNASLNLMYDVIARAMLFGILGETPWCRLDEVKFLCPVPGYDRHFRITETMGIKMINIPMTQDGPDMDMVESLVAADASIKGIWCVPKFSNPGGVVYSEETVKRMAALKPAARDFRIFWDNAYVVHYLYEDDQPEILDIIGECEKAGNPDMVFEFASTSKVTFPGAGISVFAASHANLAEQKKYLGVQTIGYDKVNMMRHVAFLKDMDTMKAHMMRQAKVMLPKFEAVENVLEKELGGLGIGQWTNPKGGYFISFQSMPGTAKRIIELCKEAGVVMTPAGSEFPYGKDPEDKYIRIAPSYPTPDELSKAADIFVLAVKLACVEKLLTA